MEQKENNIPGLEEAAGEYAYTNWQSDDYHEGASEGLPFDPIGHTENSFIAGAKWMAEQGVPKKKLCDHIEMQIAEHKKELRKLQKNPIHLEVSELMLKGSQMAYEALLLYINQEYKQNKTEPK